jgi:Adenylyl/Guanylyl and SMODS C-terminal sensor domain
LERSGSHYITNRCEPEGVGRFEASDPEAFNKWIDERERLTNGHFIKAVRLMKYLRDFKDRFQCKSIILMTLLGNQVNAIEAGYVPELYADVPSTLVTLLSKLANTLPMTMPTVMDPARTGENFTDRYGETWNYENFRACIVYYAECMRDAKEEEDIHFSILKWRRVFGDKFKPGMVISKALHDPFSVAVACSGEQFIDQPPYNFPVCLDPSFRTWITGRVTGFARGGETQYNGFRQFEIAKHGNVVPKNRSLEFTIRTTVPAPYMLYWKVRNGGVEASRHHELRGEISKDEGSLQKVETTLYTGKHYVECYVVKRGVVVSKDRQHVIVPSNR